MRIPIKNPIPKVKIITQGNLRILGIIFADMILPIVINGNKKILKGEQISDEGSAP